MALITSNGTACTAPSGSSHFIGRSRLIIPLMPSPRIGVPLGSRMDTIRILRSRVSLCGLVAPHCARKRPASKHTSSKGFPEQGFLSWAHFYFRCAAGKYNPSRLMLSRLVISGSRENASKPQSGFGGETVPYSLYTTNMVLFLPTLGDIASDKKALRGSLFCGYLCLPLVLILQISFILNCVIVLGSSKGNSCLPL
ncbi:hypothetical protein ARNL5_03030 [Anaerolineae bacterium]|nr:hypothetical protein ARNL5_03030 [Anaerolineae bacterium]